MRERYVAQLYAKIPQTDLSAGVVGEADDLGVGRGTRPPNQLHTDLGNLFVPTRSTTPTTNDPTVVTETKRAGCVAKAGSDNACDLGRDVRTQHGDFAAIWINESKQFAWVHRFQAALDSLGVLEGRGGDQAVAIEFKLAKNGAREAPALRGEGRK